MPRPPILIGRELTVASNWSVGRATSLTLATASRIGIQLVPQVGEVIPLEEHGWGWWFCRTYTLNTSRQKHAAGNAKRESGLLPLAPLLSARLTLSFFGGRSWSPGLGREESQGGMPNSPDERRRPEW
jgi:hypothetical protein